MIRLAALYSHPMPYTAPLFREISERPDVDLTVYFLSRQGAEVITDHQFGQAFKWDVPVLEGYRYKFLPNLRKNAGLAGFFELMNLSAFPEIVSARHDVLIVHGYAYAANWLAMLAAKCCGTRLIMHGESHLLSPPGRLRRMVKQAVLRPLYRSMDAVAYIGTENRRYNANFGVVPQRMFPAPYTVDNEFFQREATKLRCRRSELRRALGITDDAPIILYVGKLYEVKQPETVFKAFADLRGRHRCHLVFVGDGVLRGRIENLRQQWEVPDVIITGFVNQARISEMYISADVLVLPGRETWGLVVNEAMLFGLPVIVSDRVGSGTDLVLHGENGYVFPHLDWKALSQYLEHLVVQPELRERFGNKSREIMRNWTVQTTADGIIEAARFASGKS